MSALGSTESVRASATSAGTASAGTPAVDEVKQAIDSRLAITNQSVANLQKVTPPSDFKQFQQSLTATLQGMANQLTKAQQSYASGDHQGALVILNQQKSGFSSAQDSLAKKYPQLISRLVACPTPTP